MARFQYEHSNHPWRNHLISFLTFFVIVAIFSLGLSAISEQNITEQYSLLEDAMNRNIMNCYAMEGRYPESLDYLITVYGLQYDSDRFYIDYQPSGSNLLPDYTIIIRSGD